MKSLVKPTLLLLLMAELSGCASLGEGVAKAFLDKQTSVDTRQCEVWGKSFDGVSAHLDNGKGKMKILMVHGVGDHLPGYSTHFLEKLAKELDLPVMSAQQKNIPLTSRLDGTKNLGNLRVNRLLSKDRRKELLFYELTWSVITAKQKEVLAYDNSGEYSFRRAEVNNLLKKFSNDTGPDPIIYLGESREDILVSFAQSFCWMTKTNWDGLPDGDASKACSFNDDSAAENIKVDQYAFVSHSLGSRIAIDGMQRIATLLDSRDVEFRQALKDKTIPMYMMSNQLPMLQLGRKLPDVNNQYAAYCHANGAKYNERMVAKTPIFCIDVTNININVATIFDAFGLGKMANPLDAHIGYDTDDRVIALIAKGIGNAKTAKIVNERCQWIETI
ncbi:MAG: hypothetical protein NTV00_16240 [Methylococcales bacterium]|nr:hypothetical protein [Methylococcales bacterium]